MDCTLSIGRGGAASDNLPSGYPYGAGVDFLLVWEGELHRLKRQINVRGVALRHGSGYLRYFYPGQVKAEIVDGCLQLEFTREVVAGHYALGLLKGGL